MSAVGPLALPRTSKMCVVVAARRHPLHKCAMMQPRGCGSRDVPRKCPVQTRVRADVRRSFGWGRVVVRVVCAMCAQAVSERGAKMEILGSSILAMKQTFFGMVVMKTYQVRSLMFLEKF